MSKNVKKYKNFLLFLVDSTVNKSQIKCIFKNINKNQLSILIEVIYNILQGVVPIPTQDMKFIQNHKNKLRKIVDRSISLSNKKKLLSRYIKPIIDTLRIVKKSLQKLLK